MAATTLTALGYISLVAQLNWRRQHKKPALKAQLKAARSLGDLSENADYQAARREDKLNEARINEILQTLARAKLAPARSAANRPSYNSTVVLKRADGKLLAFNIVGDDEAIATEANVGLSSDVARQCLNKKVGDVVVVIGERQAHAYTLAYTTSW